MKHHQNIKNPLQGKQKLKIFQTLFIALIVTFLLLNFISSQIVSPLYFQFVNNNKSATISFLQKIKNLPEYQKTLEMNNNIYGDSVKKEIYEQDNKIKALINNLEQQLDINPKARDVLFSLYQLYLTEEDKNRAADYLRQAKEIDPNIK